ncbi:MAG: SH3 domain-containing protein [Anaerolineae bacterium]|nr:SH3 domain-containing protein [Anaerolineae bacterium]
MAINQALLQATRQASGLLRLPELLLKAFIAVEGANPNHRDGVLQVIPSTRAALIPRIPRALKLAALGLDSGSTLPDADLNTRFAQAFESRNLLVQVVTGGYYIREQLDRFHGYVALAGLAYNAGPARAARDIRELWGDDPYLAALQYHKKIGTASNQVTVQPGIPQIDPATGVRWIRYPVIANDSGKEIFQYLYLRRVPKRNWGLLDFIFRPRLLEPLGLFDNDQPPGEDRGDRALAVANGQFRFVEGRVNYMFSTQPLSQRDPRWKDIPLGFTTEGRTIGSDGCTLTCVTMMANGFGFQETPASLNEKLKALGRNQGFFGARIAWFGVARVLNGLRVDRLADCRNAPAPMGDIDAALEAGLPVIVELDHSPSPGFQNHWVLIYAKEGNDYLIHDPWTYPTETRATLKQRYGFAGMPAQIITYAVFYSHPNFQPTPIPPPQPQLVVVVNDTPSIRAAGGLALRDKPSVTNGRLLTRLPAGTVLTPLEPPKAVREKVGVFNQWLRVRTPDNREGWVAAWLVHTREVLPGRALEGDEEMSVQPALAPRLFARTKQSEQPIPVFNSPDDQSEPIADLKPGRRVEVLGDVERIGESEGWIHIRLNRKQQGYVRASQLEPIPMRKARRREVGLSGTEPIDCSIPPSEPDALPILRVTAPLGLNLRREPSTATSTNILRVLPLNALILLRDPLDVALPNIGKAGEWLAVSTADGVSGFVSAEFVALFAAPPESAQIIARQGVALAAESTGLCQAPGSDSHWQVAAGTPMRLIRAEDWSAIGDDGQMVEVETFAFKRGLVPARTLRVPDYPDVRARVDARLLPQGISAWLYGIHDEFDRGLFDGSGKAGWVLITDRVVSGTGRDYTSWSRAGYGVIARLNNDYGGSGTIPTPDRYLQFADQCRRWVQNSQGCQIWVIGNEMNNPREWPNQDPVNPGNNLADAITPERYAACFNRVRAAIKSVQPNAIVVPGAIDPFQGPRMSCLEYFQRMLDAIVDLDGIALHCYTHGYTPDLVTSLETFRDDPLRWQYYHFRSYTTLLDVIPPRHRNKPVYITETNPQGTTPWAGGQNGWVQAAYAEIERYNAQPHAPQIQTLILYRWSRDDHYSIVDKPGVQADIRATIRSTDYRWRR